MKATVRNHLAGLPSPGFFARLSNIIIIQMLFVFVAMALLIFFPGQQSLVDTDLTLQKTKLQVISKKTSSLLDGQVSSTENLLHNEKIQSSLFPLFLEEEAIKQAEIFVSVVDQEFVSIFTFQKPGQSCDEGSSDYGFSNVADAAIIRLGLKEPQAFPISSICCAKHLVHYYPFQLSANHPAVLVAVTEHDLVISNRSRLKYALFVLFLCSVLVSLLTVYLISNRFKGPLDRLIHGFEKTAGGELFYLFEAHGDMELKKLAVAFNRMSESLWLNYKKLKQSNYSLAKANRASLESQLFLATLIDNSPSCVVTADSQGRIMIFNCKASEDFGYDKEEAIGRNVDKLFTNAVRESRIYQPPGAGQSGVEVLCRRRDGSTFPAYLIVSPIMTREGNVTAYLYIIRDISESKNFQQMMIRLDRYYTRGEMAGQVAHEINNYLAVLSGNIELLPLMWGKGDQDKFHHRLEVMKQTVDKIARFSDGLMDTDPDKSAFEPADINQLVENTVAFLKPQNKFDNIEITTTLSPHLSLVGIDVAQIQQLLVNLLYNAAEALEDQPDQKRIWITTSVAGEGSSKSVQIEIKDNGPGVAEEKREQLFTKRFTTKRKGHGIGLITCRKIIEAHNGRLVYRQEEGATFRFDVPIKRQGPTDGSTAVGIARQSSQPA
jgi:two-component system sensor kinase FixL